MNFVPLVLSAVLTVLHYFSEEISGKIEQFHDELISFSAGLFITMIFTFLLPEFFHGAEVGGDLIFIFLLTGFIFFHIAEKYIYQHVKNKKEMLKDLAEVHALGFFLDHFIIGIALVFAFQAGNLLLGLAVFLSLLVHTLASSITLTHIDSHFNQALIINLILSISPMAGVIFAEIMKPDLLIYHSVFSFALGGLMYISIRDLLPKNREGNSMFFLIGFITSIALVYGIKLIIM